MKNTIKTISSLSFAFILIAATGCMHDTDDLENATQWPVIAEVFIDGFASDMQYAAFAGSDVKAFDVDTEVKYKGSASMKIVVPDENDPKGTYAGGAYYSTMGRDLSGYNCLTFWAKATESTSVEELGFGVDMGENKYKVSLFNLAVNTAWKKHYIPIPDPFRLKVEKGLFFFGDGAEGSKGYTFWIDEVQFENLGTIAHLQPKIRNGAEEAIIALIGRENIIIGNGSATFNLPDGTNRDMEIAVAYFDFASSDTTVATVSAEGVITILKEGSTVISARMGDREVTGKITVNALWPETATVFIDTFTADVQYEPFEYANANAFKVDTKVKYNGTSSLKITVPDENDPNGAYAGGAYYSNANPGRDLSGYNCLTFWAKATKQASVDEIGFGIDIDENKYQASVLNLPLDTDWKKYRIPIPIPARLTSERGLFFLSETPENGMGYTFWIDEVKFDKQEDLTFQPKIQNGKDTVIKAFVGQADITVGSGSATFNLPDGTNRNMKIATAYFDFFSSNENVATVDAEGAITILDEGQAVISAKMDGVAAAGRLTIHSADDFLHASKPTVASSRVISIFSDAYTNVPVEFFNGYWEPYQTTRMSTLNVKGDKVLHYSSFNFVGNQFSKPAVDASGMSHIHFDVFVLTNTTEAKLKITLRDFGPDGGNDDDTGGEDDTDISQTFDLISGEWNRLDIPLEDMARRNKAGLIIYENDGSRLDDFYLDNIYFYRK